jgi:hypothetical protein
MPRRIISTLTLGALLVCGALLAAAPNVAANQPESNAYWSQVRGLVPEESYLGEVFMVDQANAWIAGSVLVNSQLVSRIYKLQWQQGRWSVVYSHDFEQAIDHLVAISDNNVWVVGPNGFFMHKDDQGWRQVRAPFVGDANVTFQTIQMLGNGEEGWVGGSQYTGVRTRPNVVLLHYKDGAWEQETSVVPPDAAGISALHLAGRDSGWAIGSGKPGGEIWRITDGAWLRENVPPCAPVSGCASYLYSLHAVSNDEAWIVGEYSANYQPPVSQLPLALHRVNGRWEQVLPGAGISGDPYPAMRIGSVLADVGFGNDGAGVAVGAQVLDTGDLLQAAVLPLIMSLRSDGRWHYEVTPGFPRRDGAGLRAVSQVDSTHALAVGNHGFILAYGYGGEQPAPPTPIPTAVPRPTQAAPPTNRVPDPQNPNITYFPVVGHTLRGGFRDYWNAHGSLPQFGYPLTEEFQEQSPTDGKTYTVQYFERARFEWHPENRAPYDVLLGLLGHTVTSGRQIEAPFQRTPQRAAPNIVYFPETGHNMAPEFLEYWRSHGGLPVYGYPISEPFMEKSPTDGKEYLVQYFELQLSV